jgi:hypothetical protein
MACDWGFFLVSGKSLLVQVRNWSYVSGNSWNAAEILRVLKALKPDATDPGGVVGQQFTPPKNHLTDHKGALSYKLA